MKFVTSIILLVTCLIVAASPAVMRQWSTELDAILENCSRENNIEKDVARRILTHQIQNASAKNEKCLMSCFMKARGLLVDHTINWKGVIALHDGVITNPRVKKLVEQVFKRCEQSFSYDGKDDCQIAYDAYHCK